MVSQKVTVVNPTGFHVRPAGKLCEEAVKFEAHIIFKYGENAEANAKSMLSVLGACIKNGDVIEFVCEGKDEKEALAMMVSLVESGFGEH